MVAHWKQTHTHTTKTISTVLHGCHVVVHRINLCDAFLSDSFANHFSDRHGLLVEQHELSVFLDQPRQRLLWSLKRSACRQGGEMWVCDKFLKGMVLLQTVLLEQVWHGAYLWEFPRTDPR